ncbi:MAG: ACP S-malonyltransferase [Eubacteriales bacterium]|nr:ACP S-malonyltransferase [Eubacteriales bacterium]MDD4541713.1 ACP S-malonyltransferase [Eubacteriales bacterium]
MSKQNKWVFLYGGQGAQVQGMGLDFARAYPEESFYNNFYCTEDELEFLLDPDFEHLDETRYVQLALTVYSLTITEVLRNAGIEADAALGLSAGEFPALALAGVYSEQAVLEIIRQRADLMARRMEQRRQDGCDDGMLVVLGLEEAELKKQLVNYPDLSMANKNSETQMAVSGRIVELELLEQDVLNAGAKRAVFLEVEGAYHSKVFAADVPVLREVLLEQEAREAKIDLPLNIIGEPAPTADTAKENTALYADLMSRQMANPTRLDDCFTHLLEQGYTNFIEIAPKAVLTPLLRRRDRSLNLHHIADLESFETFKDHTLVSQRN